MKKLLSIMILMLFVSVSFAQLGGSLTQKKADARYLQISNGDTAAYYTSLQVDSILKAKTGNMYKSGNSLYYINGMYRVRIAKQDSIIGSSFLTGLIGYWKFDEASGTATDATGSNNLTVTGAVQNVTGKLGKAISFSGTTDRVGYLDILKPTAAVSISAWVKTTATGNRAIAGNQHWTNNGYALMVVDGYPRMSVYSSVQTPTSITAYSNVSVNDGNWHYVVGTFDGTNAKTYVDGALTNTSGSWAHAITYDSRSRFVIGQKSYSDGSDYPWNGTLDEVGVHSRAVSLSEIQGVVNSNLGKAYPFFP